MRGFFSSQVAGASGEGPREVCGGCVWYRWFSAADRSVSTADTNRRSALGSVDLCQGVARVRHPEVLGHTIQRPQHETDREKT